MESVDPDNPSRTLAVWEGTTRGRRLPSRFALCLRCGRLWARAAFLSDALGYQGDTVCDDCLGAGSFPTSCSR